jgi:hypothetical protein
VWDSKSLSAISETTQQDMGWAVASFITLWNGEPGDGPGGTRNIVELVHKLTGRQPIIIDLASL